MKKINEKNKRILTITNYNHELIDKNSDLESDLIKKRAMIFKLKSQESKSVSEYKKNA